MSEEPKHVKIARSIFDEYVPKAKRFDRYSIITQEGMGSPQYVWGCWTPASPTLKLEYNYDGVYIYYYERVTTHLGDTDLFRDTIVTVDGKNLVNEEFE